MTQMCESKYTIAHNAMHFQFNPISFNRIDRSNNQIATITRVS